MGRRPVGTGPKREGGIGGLVAYHSDEEEDEEALGGAAAAASGKRDRMEVAAAEGGDARDREDREEEEEEAEVDEEAERRRVQQAAAEAEDLFKSLETEMQTTGSSRPSHPEGGATATPPLAFATAEAAAAAAARPPEPPPVVVPPVEVPRLSPQELKKLTAGKPAAEAEALRAQLQEVLEFVDEAQGMSSRWRAEAIRVTARLQDWREGLLPSSSLVQRAKEVCTARDAEIEAEEEAAAAVAAAAEESKEELENAGTAGAAALAAPLPPIVEAPPLPPPPPPPAEPEPAQELELMAVVVPETRKQEEGDKGQWAAVWDSTYDSTYWYNAKTGETTWEMPAGIKPSPAPAAPAPAPAQAAAVAAEGGATSASSNGSSANGRDLASPVPVTGVGGDALLLYNGERPFVQTAEAVIRLFAGAGPRQVRDLGAGYFCVVFANPGGGAKGIRVAATGGDKDEEIRRAAGNWVEGAKATSIRFVLPQDEPDRLTLVPVAATEEGVDEGYEYDFGTGPTAATAAVAEPAVVKKGKVVVSSVVAAAPAMRRKRPAAAAVEDGGGGKNGAGSDVGGKRQNP